MNKKTKHPMWMNGISNAFTGWTKEFAKAPSEQRAAQKVLMAALRKNIGYKDYIKHLRLWMKHNLRDTNNKPLPATHIRRQINRASRIENYFPYDTTDK